MNTNPPERSGVTVDTIYLPILILSSLECFLLLSGPPDKNRHEIRGPFERFRVAPLLVSADTLHEYAG